jgi:hypothetical protein
VELYALEFRAGLHAVLIWNGGEGPLDVSDLRSLLQADADLTSPPPLCVKYFQGAIQHLEATKAA